MNERNDEQAPDYKDPTSWVILILCLIMNIYSVIQSHRAIALSEEVTARTTHVHHHEHGPE